MGPKTQEALVKLLTREEPLQLKELRLEQVKGSALWVNRTIEAMAGKCKLKLLGLRDAGLNDHSISLLEDFVGCNQRLEHLDIAFNRILPTTSLRLLDTLTANAKGLRFLDLSWNALSSGDENLTAEIGEALGALVRGSRSLQHLNLSRTGLTHNQACLLFRAVRKSRSLLAVHLSGNGFS